VSTYKVVVVVLMGAAIAVCCSMYDAVFHE
jgi:hypothetical protein